MKKYIYFLLALLIAFTSCKSEGKEMRKALREGNKEYKSERYVDAEIEYRRAQDEDMRSSDAAYNLGNSLFRQNKNEEAQKQYKFVEDHETDKEKKAMAWHNSGNICMANEDYKGAVNAYRNSMKNNPNDEETRYNLALAQWLLKKEEEENQDNQNQNQEQEQEQEEEQEEQQNQDKNDQNEDQEQNQEQNQDQESQDQEEEKEEEQQQDSSQMSQEQAEQILEALMQEERETQEKVQLQEQQKAKQQVTDKNW